MTYQPNIPLASDKISQSQVDLEQNFQQLDTRFSQDHVSFSTGTNSGFHKQVTIPSVLGADPVVANPAGIFYTKAVAGVTEAFFRNQTVVTQLTGLPEDIVGEGSITLAAGLIIKWGTIATGTINNTLFTYPIPFPTQVFSLVVTPALNNTSVHSCYMLALPNSGADNNKVGFKLRSDVGGWLGFSYIAIGN